MSLSFPRRMSVGGSKPGYRPSAYIKRKSYPVPQKFIRVRQSRLSGETKYIDNIPAANGGNAGSAVNIPNAGVIMNWWPIQNGGAFSAGQSLVQIPQGTTKNTRIGNKSRLYALRGRLSFFINSGNTGDVIRCILFEDRQCNGAAANVADVLEYASINSFQAMDYVDQIKILFDKSFALNPPTSVAAGENSCSFWKHVKFNYKKVHELHYNNTTGTLGGIVSSNLNMLLIGSSGGATDIQGSAAGTNSCSFIRTYFKDL